MALTHTQTSGNNLLSFTREKSNFKSIAFLVGGAIVILFGFVSLNADTPVLLSVIYILFGISFFAAAFYLPYINERFTHEQIIFESDSQMVVLKMANGNSTRIPFTQIKEFVIDVENRSPSAANSKGIHYLHHHVSILRANGAKFTITSTTDKQEAEKICNLLKQTLSGNHSTSSKIEYSPSNKILVENGASLEISWQSNRYKLSVDKQLRYSEYKSNGNIEISKEFSLTNFSHVEYTYANTIQNKNFSVYIHFHQQEPTKLGLFLKDLNPIECLQFENWLHEQLAERKNAIA